MLSTIPPAFSCLLDDEIVGVPNGVHPASFLFARYASEDKLPRPRSSQVL